MRLLEDVQKLIRQVEPSMAETPVYLLNADEFGVVDMPPDVLAFTSYLLDLQMAKRLDDRGAWHGPGFAAVVFGNRIPAIPRFVAGACLHELSHWLTFPARPSFVGDDLAETAAIAATVFELATEAEHDTQEERPQWFKHDPDFVRAATHLAYRAGRLDPEIRPWNLEFALRYYGLDEMAWMRVLADECRAMADVPIRDILTTEPPRDFLELVRLLTAWWDHPDRAKESVS